jgi:hypothetical protein
MAGSHLTRELQHLATGNCIIGTQALSAIRRNTARPHAQPAPRCMLNQDSISHCPSQASTLNPSHKQQDIYIETYDTHDTVYSDQTGKFPHTSSRGNHYQMILYHSDSNSIWVELTKNRTEGELILACTQVLTLMCACGITPWCQVLDNEASEA